MAHTRKFKEKRENLSKLPDDVKLLGEMKDSSQAPRDSIELNKKWIIKDPPEINTELPVMPTEPVTPPNTPASLKS